MSSDDVVSLSDGGRLLSLGSTRLAAFPFLPSLLPRPRNGKLGRNLGDKRRPVPRLSSSRRFSARGIESLIFQEREKKIGHRQNFMLCDTLFPRPPSSPSPSLPLSLSLFSSLLTFLKRRPTKRRTTAVSRSLIVNSYCTES